MRWEDIATPEPDWELVGVFADFLEDAGDPRYAALRYLIAQKKWPININDRAVWWFIQTEVGEPWTVPSANFGPWGRATLDADMNPHTIRSCAVFCKKQWTTSGWRAKADDWEYVGEHTDPILGSLQWFADLYLEKRQ